MTLPNKLLICGVLNTNKRRALGSPFLFSYDTLLYYNIENTCIIQCFFVPLQRIFL